MLKFGLRTALQPATPITMPKGVEVKVPPIKVNVPPESVGGDFVNDWCRICGKYNCPEDPRRTS